MFRGTAAGGAEYGVQQAPASRPVPQGYAPGQSPVQQIGRQVDQWLDDAQREPQAPADPNTVVLSKPYMAHGEPVHSITLRKPTTREIKVCGTPLRVLTDANGRIQDIEMKWDVVAKYIPLLATPPLPPSTVDEFDYFDLDSCGAVLAPFFVRLAPSAT